MNWDINLILGIFSIVAGAITAWLCYKIYQYNRLSRWWLAIVWAFILIIFRRLMGFLKDFQIFSDYIFLFKPTEYVLLVLISLLTVIGFWAMLKNFENFKVIDSKVKNKLKVDK